MAESFNVWGKGSRDSQPYWREALALRKQLGDDPVAIANCMHGLAGSLGSQSEEAENLLREVLPLYRQQLGTESPKYIASLFLLGQELACRGKLEEAETILRQTHDLYRKIYDKNHPYQPIVLRYLVQVLEDRGKGDEAEALIRQQQDASLTGREYFALLGALQTYRGNWPEAAEQLSHAVEMLPNEPWLAMRLSAVFLAAKRYDDYRMNCHRLLGDSLDQRDKLLAAEAALRCRSRGLISIAPVNLPMLQPLQ